MAKEIRNVVSRAWNSRATAWGAVGVLVVAVLVAAVSVGLSIFAPVSPSPSAPATAATAAPVTPVTPGPDVTARAEGCNVPAGDAALRPAVPSDLRWVASQGLTWPVSDTYGPTQTKDGFAVCFARSPLGAALAAGTMLYSQYNGHTPKEAATFYAVDSPGKSVLLNNTGGSSSAGDLAKSGMTLVGFVVDEFTPDRAGISAVYSLPQSETGYLGIPVTLVWVDGDWRMKVLDNGNFGTPNKPVQGQFVQWRPANG